MPDGVNGDDSAKSSIGRLDHLNRIETGKGKEVGCRTGEGCVLSA